MRLPTRLAAVAALCLVATSAMAQPPVALQNTNNLSDCSVIATCRTNLGAAASGANTDITSLGGLSTPLSISQGGTGASTASGARAAIGAAASGANSDITSLGAITSMTLQNLQVTQNWNGPTGNLLASSTAPVVASGFGTGPTITANGTYAFAVKVGTGGTASTGTLTMPAAKTGWNCTAVDQTTKSATVASTQETGSTTTSVSFSNYTDILAMGAAWGAGDVLQIQCLAY